MIKITKEQAIIITGYTGYMACKFLDFHEDLEKRMGRPVFTHELGNKDVQKRVEDLYYADFLAMLPEEDK